MADIEDYLQEGWNPNSVTIPKLRSILVTHNVDYPSTAKKAQLVQLVTDEVLPQAGRLRAQRARAHRTSFGIVNAGSAEDDSRWADEPPTPARRSKTPRKSSARVKVEEEEPALSVARPTSKRASRSVSRALSHTDERESVEPEMAKGSRRSSRRTVTPQIKAESEEESEGDGNPFSDDNPFQSGSSPPTVKTPTSRRRTGGEEIFQSSRSARRRTDGYTEPSSSRKSFGHTAREERSESPEDELEPGEEFTPDEQLELEVAASKGESSALARQPRRQPGRKTSLTLPMFVLLTALMGAYATWYRQEKLAVGYCGVGRPVQPLIPSDVPVPDALVPLFEPQCEPCPSHAYCYADMSVRCESDFVLQPHPLSLGGLVPLPPTCEPDGEKVRRVQAVADKAVEELRERRAKFECGDLVDEEGHQADSPAIDEEELKASVSQKRSKRLNSDEFEELWAAAIGEVTKREEIEVIETPERPGSTGSEGRQLSSTSLARLPLTCAAKRSVRLGLARYRLPIGLLILSGLFGIYMRFRYRQHVALSAQVPALVDLVLGRLSNQKVLGEEDVDDPWLFLPNLRDDVLRSVHSLSERDRIWQKVKAVVELNSNVRTSQREGRSGEVGRAWEWIGPVAGDGVRRRKSGRVSWGADVKSESPVPEGPREVKKWDEPRPVY
ncbi:hypothetical protein CC79DRAFT_439864 [Sarocladium strictum]